MTLTLAVALASLFVAVTVGSYVLFSSAAENRAYRQAVNQLSVYDIRQTSKELTKPFFQRVIAPALEKVTGIFPQLTPQGLHARYERKLKMAGMPYGLDVDSFLGIKMFVFVAFVVLAALGVLAASGGPGTKLLLVALLLFVGAYGPDAWLDRIIDRRRIAIKRALPDVLDLLVISVEAGLGFDAALQRIVKHSRGPLADEFAHVLYEIQVGVPRREAFRNLADRTAVDELRTFSHAISQADVFGVSVGKVLRTQATELRTIRRQKAEELAQKIGVKIVFPLILCIFPAIFVVILGPAVLRVYAALFGG